MVDIKYIRDNADKVKEAVKNKNISLDVDKLLALDARRLEALQLVESLSAEKNKLNDAIKMAKSDAERQEIIGSGKAVKDRFIAAEADFREIDKEFQGLMVKVPTVPSSDTPVGKDDSENVEVSVWGEKKDFDFQPKDHMALAEDLGIIDFERGAKIAGYRGYYLKNEGALLAMALMNYAFQKMVSKGYSPMITPTLIKGFALFGSGYFQGAEYNSDVDNIYQIATSDQEADGQESKEKKFLSGTSEPALLAYYSDQVLEEKDLPIRVCGFSQCYRSEIGSYGKDVRGLYRVHEFMKVEQVVICRADVEESIRVQEEMVAISEEIHQELGLPYRKLQICTGDMSAGKFRAFDLEAWMPGLNRYGETGSASNFCDWQARRLNVRYKDSEGNRKYAFLLNNTVLPSVRPLIAVLENYQQADGSVLIPEILQPFMPKGMTVIKKK